MIIFIVFILLIIGIGIFLYMYYSRESKLAEGIAYYDNDDYEKALEVLKSYIVAKPYDIRARKYLAELYLKQNEYILALKECIAITVSSYATFKEKADAYAKMAEIYIEQGILDKATKVAVKGFKLEPKNAEIHYSLGKIYLLTDKLNSAIKEFNLVLSVDRTHIPARLKLAEIHFKNRNDIKAIFQYKKIIELEPNNKEAHFELAKLYYENGEYENAKNEIEKIKDRKGIEIDCDYILVNYYLKVKNKEKAKEIMEKAILGNDIKNEKLTSLRYELGVIYEEEGNFEGAYELYEKIKLDILRYRDIEKRMQKIKKVLFPEEHAKMVQQIDYNKLPTLEFEDLFYKVIDSLGYKEAKLIKKNRNLISIIAVEKFKTLLQGKYLIEMGRNFESVSRHEVEKFLIKIKDEGAKKGILISTSTFNDAAIKLLEEVSNLELVDKVNIYELA
ncbi:tetratricopeptide repeat protein [Haliovirga abyssi]|uniref:Restriction endonuclease type IV Mrr domain-containing protein n=1 Tax=Haliovirga abyssi TaxID=2996794 RepID=A0AAU9D254_9FUSO|nr:tetratricopeptide repeat protein [Haliovirga abyssi]BDU50081.1 hypothetical protein HLVA_06500 [Haliovirga abyssi]